MRSHKILSLGGGLGDVWICSKEGAATADVGCAVNCADFAMQYRYGVKVFWLHIAYHGRLDGSSWQDRVLGALCMVLNTLLQGEDVAVHCVHGSHWKKYVCVVQDASAMSSRKAWKMSTISNIGGPGTCPRSQVHEASASLHIFFFTRQTPVRFLCHPLDGLFVRGPRSSC